MVLSSSLEWLLPLTPTLHLREAATAKRIYQATDSEGKGLNQQQVPPTATQQVQVQVQG